MQATNTATGCVADDDITITVNPAAPPFSFTDQTFCPSGSTAIALPAGPAGMTSYSWTPATLINNPTSNGPTATIKTPLPSTQTTYTLTITNADGCKSSADVKYTPSVSNPVAGSSRNACKGTPVQLGVSPGMSGTYSWSVSPSSGATYTMSSTSISNPVFTPTSAGTFTITVSYTESGCTTTDVVTITGIDYTAPAVASPSVCANTCVQIGVSSPEAGAAYAWSPATGLSDPNIYNPVACVTSSNATYRLTITGANGCIATQDVIVGVSNAQAPSVNVPPAYGCYGSGSATFFPNISPSGTYNYLWSPNDGTVQDIYAKNAVVYITSPNTKTYNLGVTDVSNGCSSTAKGILNVSFCSLPVKLIDFTAKGRESSVELEWKVSQEIDLSYYEVERSADGKVFSGIGKVKAVNSSVYQLVDNYPANGVNYYRLKSVNVDGNFTYSEVRKVLIGASGSIGLYPNPSSTIVHVTFSAGMQNKKANLFVFAADGRIVFRKQIETLKPAEVITTTGFAKGQYYVRISTENQVVIKPLIIAR
ncbi:MAG: T9SS type A sorting domain-containing protein [Chitinophagaceae bacterium]